MNFLRWLAACFTVYMKRLVLSDNMTLIKAAVIIFFLMLAAAIGQLATLFVIVVAIIALPALNPDIKKEIDEEYTRRKN